MKKKKNVNLDVLRTIRAQDREEEIKAFGRSILHSRIRKSKKVYDRKKTSARRFWERGAGEI